MTKIWPIPTIEFIRLSELTESRPVLLVTTAAAWQAVGEELHLSLASKYEVSEADEEVWKSAAASLEGEVVYAVGGGLAVDTAKYLAQLKGLPLFCLPTALSVDAFLTWASGVRIDGCVKYLETQCPDRLLIDFEVLRKAPASIRAAGVCDVLSIATGTWDWQYAEVKEMTTPTTRFVHSVADAAIALLKGCLECAEAAGKGDPGGMKQLLDCLALEVQLCNLIGHSRPEEGSEHYFAYSVENEMGKGLPHGNLVGPGILLLAGLQGQETTPLKRALLAGGIPLGSIPKEVAMKTLRGLPDYVVKHQLAFSYAHVLTERHFADAERIWDDFCS